MKALAASVIFLITLSLESWAGSAIYQWQDPDGKVYFTDNPMTIPTEYWNQIVRDWNFAVVTKAEQSRATRVAVERAEKAIVVPVLVNGHHRMTVYLDTGSTYCQITHEDARALSLSSSGGPWVKVLMADGRTLEAQKVTLDSMRIGSLEIRNVEALVGDLRLLGLNVLQRFRVTLDLPRGEVVLEAPH